MVWQQGEGDARDIAGIKNALSYGANLNNLIKRIRADLEAPGLAFIYGSVLPRCPLRPVFRAGKKCGRGKRWCRKIPYLPLRQQCGLCPRRRSPAAQRGLPHPLSHGYRPSGYAWNSGPRNCFASALEKLWRQKKLIPRLFFLPHFLQPRQPHPENQ